jgi:pSer/pThr/pTyr-binding forkhead associated (FHA) protein
MATFSVTDGPATGRSIECDREVVIGREGADFVLDDPEISRRHAALRPVSGGIEIEDLGSHNGTFVEGERLLATTTLSKSVTLRMGATSFALELTARDLPLIDTQQTKVSSRAEEHESAGRTVMRVQPIVEVPERTVVRPFEPVAPPVTSASSSPAAAAPPAAAPPQPTPPGAAPPFAGPPGPLPRPVRMMMKSPLGRRLFPLMARLPPRARKPVLLLIPILLIALVVAIVVLIVNAAS